MLKFLVVGLFQGATYGLLAVGLVLVYRGTKAFNFAQGEFGSVAAFIAFALFENAHLPYGIAVIVALVCAVALGLIVERVIVRPLRNAPRITLLVATAGVALFLIFATFLVAQARPRLLHPAAPGSPLYFLGTGITPQRFLVLGALGALAVGLAVLFRTTLGLAVLATSQDELGARVVGISTTQVSRLIWALAALLGGLAGILQAPVEGVFAPGFMTVGTLIPAFTAAVVGGMDSLPGAFIGGELVGVAQSLGTYYLEQRLQVPGAPELTVFALLLVVLLTRPRGLLGQEAA